MRELRNAFAGCALAVGALAVGAIWSPAFAAPVPALAFDDAEPAEAAEAASELVERFAAWLIASRDNQGLPFAIVDKIGARVFVFDADGRPLGSAPVLIGSAPGDHTAPGVGELALGSIAPEARTTAAGRFRATFGPAKGEVAEVLWLDYDTALSLHPVISGNQKQRRLQRLASPTPLDNRITYGCINVPAAFYEEVVRPAFAGAAAVVYVLPEERELEEVFADFRWNADAEPVDVAVAKRAPDEPGEKAPSDLSRQLGF